MENDHVLGIFPEGTRYKIGEPGRPKSGMALIAKMTQADILPRCVLYEAGRSSAQRRSSGLGSSSPLRSLALRPTPREIKTATKKVGNHTGFDGIGGKP